MCKGTIAAYWVLAPGNTIVIDLKKYKTNPSMHQNDNGLRPFPSTGTMLR